MFICFSLISASPVSGRRWTADGRRCLTGDRGRKTGRIQDSLDITLRPFLRLPSPVSCLPLAPVLRLRSPVLEESSIRFHPLTQRLDAAGDGGLRAPAQVPLGFAVVGGIHLLVP